MLEVMYSFVYRTLLSLGVTKRNNNEAFCNSQLIHLNDNDTITSLRSDKVVCFHYSYNKTLECVVILVRHKPIIISAFTYFSFHATYLTVEANCYLYGIRHANGSNAY